MLWFEATQSEPHMDDEYSDLPSHERAKKYRELAADASKQAERVGDRKVRESYVIIAERWEEKAADIERRLGRGERGEVD
jgi:hypothetical protein